jgi:hypothetical protein
MKSNAPASSSASRRRFLLSTPAAIGLAHLARTSSVNAQEKSSTSPPPSPSGKAHYICVTCGSQFTETDGAPKECPLCQDERQYVGLNGQEWTTLETMQRGGWKNVFKEQEPNVIGIGTEPKMGIGQRTLLLRTPKGNILWDCISYLDEDTIREVKKLGGISAIAISHPHYYSSMVEWSRAFGGVPIHLHEEDRQWVQRPDAAIQFWKGETKSLGDGLTLVHTGGHFDGFQVMHWRDGAEGRGVLFAGDQPQVVSDRRWVSFMYSYPNYIPLNKPAIERIVKALEPYEYDRIYGAFWPGVVAKDGKAAVKRSVERYLKAIV